jgi:hypothetical protein
MSVRPGTAIFRRHRRLQQAFSRTLCPYDLEPPFSEVTEDYKKHFLTRYVRTTWNFHFQKLPKTTRSIFSLVMSVMLRPGTTIFRSYRRLQKAFSRTLCPYDMEPSFSEVTEDYKMHFLARYVCNFTTWNPYFQKLTKTTKSVFSHVMSVLLRPGIAIFRSYRRLQKAHFLATDRQIKMNFIQNISSAFIKVHFTCIYYTNLYRQKINIGVGNIMMSIQPKIIRTTTTMIRSPDCKRQNRK